MFHGAKKVLYYPNMRLVRCLTTAGALFLIIGRTLLIPQNPVPPHSNVQSLLKSDIEPIKRLNTIARFCAGLPIDHKSDLYDLTQTDEWSAFAAGENARWAAFKKPEEKVRAWARAELSPYKTANPSEFYPFGGPDILFANLMMPSAKLYVLVGLEPIGSIADPEAIRQTPLGDFLSQYSSALDDIIRLSFFKRADMEAEMKKPVIDGVLPVFLVLLARMEREIVSVERGRLNTLGEFVDAENDPGRKPRAVRILFRDRGRGATRTLVYLSQDLSDAAVDSNRGFRTFITNNLSHGFGYIKSASYQMHKPIFSSIARIILTVSDVVLEDDSSMPYRLFDPQVWTITLYGTYTGPIDLFKDFMQQDLLDAFAAGAKPLGFHIGYGKNSNLLLAVRKAT
jgi:hypothetical protein